MFSLNKHTPMLTGVVLGLVLGTLVVATAQTPSPLRTGITKASVTEVEHPGKTKGIQINGSGVSLPDPTTRLGDLPMLVDVDAQKPGRYQVIDLDEPGSFAVFDTQTGLMNRYETKEGQQSVTVYSAVVPNHAITSKVHPHLWNEELR
ncbi:MAG: hypothetical protein SFY68_01840 [Candidatus Sumerlaeia bacterium]|nr:hypothetical protein [Candidatus Sumerlaeia bacterium]